MKIDRFKELMVVEPSVISDPRSRNATAGPWSFRHALESMMPEGAKPGPFLLSWINTWANTTQMNGFKTDRESRSDEMQAVLICPWLKRTAANNCNDNCSTCSSKDLDLAQAPFRLLAIVNRTDLRLQPDVASAAGESRLVFGFTRGPADDPASATAAFTVILEYALPGSRSPSQWTEAWHALGKHAAFDEDYKRELEALTEGFVKRNASPLRVNGSALSQVRTNESVFNWIWQLREFKLTSPMDLALVPVANTPGESLNNSTILRDFILANAEPVKKELFVLPVSLRAGSADQFLFKWTVPGVDESLRSAFARQTCNGCHSGENPSVDTAFHISPYREGAAKLSPFVNDPNDPARDDLGRREALMQDQLCAD